MATPRFADRVNAALPDWLPCFTRLDASDRPGEGELARHGANSRSTIAVNFAPHQSIHFIVNGRDSLFEDVSRLEGRVMSVRGDTLQLKLRDWRIGNLNYAFAPKGVDVQVAVITSTAVNVAEMRPSPGKTVGAVVVTAATIVVLGYAVFLAHLPRS